MTWVVTVLAGSKERITTTLATSERRRGKSHRHCCHNQSYRQNQKYALHRFTSFPFSKRKTGPPQLRWTLKGRAELQSLYSCGFPILIGRYQTGMLSTSACRTTLKGLRTPLGVRL